MNIFVPEWYVSLMCWTWYTAGILIAVGLIAVVLWWGIEIFSQWCISTETGMRFLMFTWYRNLKRIKSNTIKSDIKGYKKAVIKYRDKRNGDHLK
ncbi:hypothetical protein DRO66_09250 [Candidatus Bathyarchaeota archaeon]|nr:MAG: hypothetical protein DRO66_09250 [Candidatus Bathyarchaeota archaeon]